MILPGLQVDQWAAFRAHLDLLATKPLYKWEAKEEKKLIFKWIIIMQDEAGMEAEART